MIHGFVALRDAVRIEYETSNTNPFGRGNDVTWVRGKVVLFETEKSVGKGGGGGGGGAKGAWDWREIWNPLRRKVCTSQINLEHNKYRWI